MAGKCERLQTELEDLRSIHLNTANTLSDAEHRIRHLEDQLSVDDLTESKLIGRKRPRYEDIASQEIADWFKVPVSVIENLPHTLWHHLACSIKY